MKLSTTPSTDLVTPARLTRHISLGSCPTLKALLTVTPEAGCHTDTHCGRQPASRFLETMNTMVKISQKPEQTEKTRGGAITDVLRAGGISVGSGVPELLVPPAPQLHLPGGLQRRKQFAFTIR
jgi:hypothetical protein